MKTRISCLLLLSACLLLSVLPAQRAVAHTKPKRTKSQTWSTAEYVLYVGLIVWVMMTSTGECAEEEPHDFLREYGGDLARLFGPGIRLVTSSCPAAPGSRDTRMLFCRCVNSTNAFTVVASLVRDAAGRIESLSFSQDLTLPGGVAVPRNQPVPLETIMRVIMLSRRAPPALMLETLSLKSFRSSVSLRGKDASGFRVIKRVAGTVPTSYKSFNLVHTFVIGMNGPSQTNPYYHTFPCVQDIVAGKNRTVYSTTFYLDSDLEHKNKVGLFVARIHKDELRFVYKEWLINPDGAFVSQAEYDQCRQRLASIPPGRYPGAVNVTFRINGEIHTASSVPVAIRVHGTSAKGSNVKPAQPTSALRGGERPR